MYGFALNKNLSVAQVKEQIQIAKGLLSSNVAEPIEDGKTLELLSPEAINHFKDQILSNIAGLAQQDAIRVLKACMKQLVNK